jgi:5-methylthioadenosine/S-adenosylhomocysteine deaminase
VAPHAADTVSKSLMAEIAGYALGRDLPIHMHLAQTAGEVARVKAREGVTPVAYVEACGALTPMTLAVHLVATGPEDAKRLKATGATAGVCPASQIAYEHLMPIKDYAAAGVPLALGTDCAASNDGADMLAELRLMALLSKDRGAGLSWSDVLATATTVPAKTLGLGAEIGLLAPGMSADVVFLKQDLTTAPVQKPLVNLMMSANARQVRHVMVAGRFVLVDGETALVSETDLSGAYDAAVATIRRSAFG